jgi:hypothetical protein
VPGQQGAHVLDRNLAAVFARNDAGRAKPVLFLKWYDQGGTLLLKGIEKLEALLALPPPARCAGQLVWDRRVEDSVGQMATDCHNGREESVKHQNSKGDSR